MSCIGSARIIFNLPAVPVSLSLRHPHSLRLFHSSYLSSIATSARWLSHRAFSNLRNDLFDYTSGRWM